MYNNSQKIRVLKYLLVIRLTILGKRIHLLDLREIASLEKPHLMFLFFRYICLQNQVNILLKIQRHLYEKLKVQFLTSQQIYILPFWPKKSSPWYLFLVTRKTLWKSICSQPRHQTFQFSHTFTAFFAVVSFMHHQACCVDFESGVQHQWTWKHQLKTGLK